MSVAQIEDDNVGVAAHGSVSRQRAAAEQLSERMAFGGTQTAQHRFIGLFYHERRTAQQQLLIPPAFGNMNHIT
ncbi:hypothetical protein ACFZC5_11095 [Nocardia gamkensis]|uniref:hypothetical protein n=1 Tax=Nocardia gamkensis TaxID=352869 RepID=UPI0036EDE95A